MAWRLTPVERSCAVVDARIITLGIRTGPTTWKPGDFEMPPEKGSKGVVVQVPGKAALVRGILESSDDEDEDDDEEMSTPFMAEDIRMMKQKELRQIGVKYKVYSYKDKAIWNSNSKMKQALMDKFGLEGSNLSDYQQKVVESSDALTTFLKSENAVAITSKIPGFDPKETAHAESFMAQYRKKHGEGSTRSRNINLNVTRTSRRVDAVLGASVRVVRRGRRDGLRRGRSDAVEVSARIL